MKRKVIAECALCRKTEQLCHSHIIPEFFYKRLYDELGRCYELRRRSAQKKIHQKGIREYLLCEHCDNNHLARYEDYMARTLFGKRGITAKRTDHGIVVEGLSYDNVRLFQLSLLWRASISRNERFREVSLGPHEETIRTMISEENPGDPDQYPCILYVQHRVHEALGDKAIKFPQAHRLKRLRTYDFYCGGLTWCYVVSGCSAGRVASDMVISKSGDLPVLLG